MAKMRAAGSQRGEAAASWKAESKSKQVRGHSKI